MEDPTGIGKLLVGNLLDQFITETRKVIYCKRDSQELLELLEKIQPLVLIAAKDEEGHVARNASTTETGTSVPGSGLGSVENWSENVRQRLEEAKDLVSKCQELKSYELGQLHMMSGKISTVNKTIAEICTIQAPFASLNIGVGTARGVKQILETLTKHRSSARSDELPSDESKCLEPDQMLVSKNDLYDFLNQGDGDLCIYKRDSKVPSWASGTSGKGYRGNLYLERHGNLVLYNTSGDGAVIWSSGKVGKGTGPYKLVMQDDGNLVIYDAHHRATWAINPISQDSSKSSARRDELPSHVSCLEPDQMLVSKNDLYEFVNQGDGNLCIYNRASKVPWCIWTSDTWGKGYRGNLYLERHGNLVLYNTSGDGAEIWSSGTTGKGTGPYKLVMQDNGNLVIYDAHHQATWAANSISLNPSTSLARTDELPSDVSWLEPNQMLVSKNGVYGFFNQGDGNLCVYKQGSNCIWASGTWGKGYRGNLYLERNGNLVLYNTRGDGAVIWSSGTVGKGTGPYKLVMQDDGNLVIYDAQHEATWAPLTENPSRSLARTDELLSNVSWLEPQEMLVSRNDAYRFVNEEDGNLCIYKWDSKESCCIWASGTSGKGYKGNLYLERNGNLVLYNTSGDGAAIWSSGRFGKDTGPYKLIMQDDGNLVIYDAHQEAIWAIPYPSKSQSLE